jgi:hypothetical protein
VKGQPVGEQFRVTEFENPARMLDVERISATQMALTEDQLFLPPTETSGNIWMLENVDQ